MINTGAQAYSYNAYLDAQIAVPSTLFGRAVAFVVRSSMKLAERTAKRDAASLDLNEGQVFPIYSGTYWALLPYRAANWLAWHRIYFFYAAPHINYGRRR